MSLVVHETAPVYKPLSAPLRELPVGLRPTRAGMKIIIPPPGQGEVRWGLSESSIFGQKALRLSRMSCDARLKVLNH